MKNLYLLISAAILLFSCTQKPKIEPNQQLSESEHLVMATAWFQKSAEMRACFYQAFNLAELRLAQHLENYKGEKPPAVVLDIDETVLDNSPFQAHLIDSGILYTNELWKEWTDKQSAKALPGALQFCKKADEMGVMVIYISNRKVNMLETTINNMQELGFPNSDPHFVHLKPMDKSGDKTERRQKVMQKYEVLLYVGDNLTDLSQMFAERDSLLAFDLVDKNKDDFGDKFIIVPNPMYGEWEEAIYSNDYSKPFLEKRSLRKSILESFK